jgi:AcrR family transcriptional regulator
MKFKTKKSKETYERVLATAMRLFKEKGYQNTTVRDLSKESELGLGAIYYYFKSKEDLVQVFYRRINSEIINEYHTLYENEKNYPEAVEKLMRLKIEKLTPYRDLIQIIIKEAVDRNSPLSPFNKSSQDVKEISIGVFEELAVKAKVKDPEAVAQQTWLFHLMLLGLWTQDTSKDSDMTFKMIGNFKSFLKISLTVSKIPGLGKLQKNIRQDLAQFFE